MLIKSNDKHIERYFNQQMKHAKLIWLDIFKQQREDILASLHITNTKLLLSSDFMMF